MMAGKYKVVSALTNSFTEAANADPPRDWGGSDLLIAYENKEPIPIRQITEMHRVMIFPAFVFINTPLFNSCLE